MTARAFPTLADVTTLRVGGPAEAWVEATTDDELVAALTEADRTSTPVLVLGGGSNIVADDSGFPGMVVRVAMRGIATEVDDRAVRLTAAAGESWDDVVALAVGRGWSGVEALSGIPGSVGATPLQNVGAYGQEVGDLVESVRAFDRQTGSVVDLPRDACDFSYRSSSFKAHPDRWAVLSVTLRLMPSRVGAVRYGQVAEALGVEVGDAAPIGDIRRSVLALRAAKGMVLDPSDHDTWSVGSFFTNPVVAEAVASTLPPDCPRHPTAGDVKLSAAWLIERAGYVRGFRLAGSSAALSGKHTLAITNRGGATSTQVLDLAAEIERGVREQFGIGLEPEPRIL